MSINIVPCEAVVNSPEAVKQELRRQWASEHGCIYPWFAVEIDPATEIHFPPLFNALDRETGRERCYVAVRMQGSQPQLAAAYNEYDVPPHVRRVYLAMEAAREAERAFANNRRNAFAFLLAEAAVGDAKSHFAVGEYDRRRKLTKEQRALLARPTEGGVQ